MTVRKNLEEKLNLLSSAIYGYALGGDTITYRLD